ncbi:hypothetical protein U9M48_011435 [Paspalum notatum var. saurae]|uniref:F-box domain-containing protein n=1 Tax=Paspalum notatum var. saurae TaxID=547442 RepID=A0AAQ3SVM0_PASNO
MASPSPLMDELVEEVLLLLPPNTPASLVRAGLVCKRWCHLVSDPGFRRRFREFHRSLPATTLGFLCSYSPAEGGNTRFVPTPASPLRRANHRAFQADSRHGRILLHGYLASTVASGLVVWDPIADERIGLPRPPLFLDSLNAAVLCAAASAAPGASACDHTDCPFVVVLVGTRGDHVFSCVYSAAAAAWGEPASAPHSGCGMIRRTRSALVGAALYFVFLCGERILEYDLRTKATSVIALPRARTSLPFRLFGPVELTTMEDGWLGFARVEKSRLCLWSRQVENDAGWALSKSIDLEKVIPVQRPWTTRPYLVGSAAEGVGAVFLMPEDQLFMVDLRSGRATKVYGHPRTASLDMVVPYMNFFTPVLMKAPSTDGIPGLQERVP